MIVSKMDVELLSVAAQSHCQRTIDCFMHVKDFQDISAKLKTHKVTIHETYPFCNLLAVSIPAATLPSVLEMDNVVYLSRQVKVQTLVHVAKKILNVPENYTGKDVTIAYIDTGLEPHIDFCLGENRLNYFQDFVSDKKKAYDDSGHGTFVAGVGSGNGLLSGRKYKGIAPQSNIVALKALDRNGEATATVILNAMSWLYENAERYRIGVVCMSFGSEPLGLHDPIMRAAEELWEKGMVVVCAAGNSGPEYQTITSPGVSPKIITVGGFDDKRNTGGPFEIAPFSSRGPAFKRFKPDLVAPAVGIISCSHQAKEGYRALSGTSVATPMAAGLCALLLEKESLSPREVKEKLLSFCKRFSFEPNQEGYGIPDFSVF